ncbi:MAG TPA: biopolymer transporter ExbD [Chitinophagaceae bacterium]
MAEIDTSSGGGKRHQGTRGKKLSTRVDMTPMCDVAFLLITFFMLTTTLQRPKTMNLYLPKDTKDPEQQNKVKESQALTILLGGKNHLYYYEGIGSDPLHPPILKNTTYALKGGIGDEIENKWKNVIQLSGARDSMVVIIKPDDSSTYENMVDMLDMMNIYQVKKYALVNISPVEKDLIKKDESGGSAQALPAGGK